MTNNAKGTSAATTSKTGKRLWIFHTLPKPGEFGYDTWLDDSAQTNGNTGAWAQLSADLELGLVYVRRRDADRRLLRRQPAGQYAVRRESRRARPQDRQAQVALSVRPSRHLGLRPAVRAGALRRRHQRPAHPRAGAADQAGVSVRAESRDRRADLADRGASRAAVDGAERADEPDAALSHQAAAVRPARRVDGRSDRLHAGAARRSARGDQAVQDRSALHAAGAQQRRRSARDACSCRRMSAARTGPARHSIRKRTASIIHSHTAVFVSGIVPANPATSDMGYVSGQARAGGAGARGAAAPAADPERPSRCAGARRWRARGRRSARRRARRHVRAGPAAHQAAVRSDHGVRHEDRRPHLAEDAQLDARRHQESSGAAGAEPAASRPARPHVHRHAHDEDAR